MTYDADRVFANIGCGPANPGRVPPLFPGWRELRVDVEPDVQPDIIADMTDLSPIASGAVDGVWCSHCVEHLYEHQVGQAFAEIRRIMAPGGILGILVPDLQTIAGVIAADRMHEALYESPAGPITPHDIVFGFGKEIAKGYTFMAHRCGFTPSSMVACLHAAGFEDFAVVRRSNYELGVVACNSAWRSTAERDALVDSLRV